MARPWRPDLYVVARFLDRLGPGDAWSKGKLQPAVRLNYDLFIRYLEALQERGLVARSGEGRDETIRITEAGQALRRRMVEWIEAVFGSDPSGRYLPQASPATGRTHGANARAGATPSEEQR